MKRAIFVGIARITLLLAMWYLSNTHGIMNQAGSNALAAVRTSTDMGEASPRRAICPPRWLPGGDLLPRWGASVTNHYKVQGDCVTSQISGKFCPLQGCGVNLNPFFAAKIKSINCTSCKRIWVNRKNGPHQPDPPFLIGALLTNLRFEPGSKGSTICTEHPCLLLPRPAEIYEFYEKLGAGMCLLWPLLALIWFLIMWTRRTDTAKLLAQTANEIQDVVDEVGEVKKVPTQPLLSPSAICLARIRIAYSKEVEAFIQNNNIDETVSRQLREASVLVHHLVRIHEASSCSNPAMLSEGPSEEEVEAFIQENSIDENVAQQLRQVGGPVQKCVLDHGSCLGPSAICLEWMRVAKRSSSEGPQLEEIEEFISENSIDEIATQKLRSAGGPTQQSVLDRGRTLDAQVEAFIRDNHIDKTASWQLRRARSSIQQSVLDRGSFVKPLTKFEICTDMLTLLADVFSDVQVVLLLLRGYNVLSATAILTATVYSTTLQVASGRARRLPANVRWAFRTGMYPESVLQILDAEKGLEAFVSLVVTIYMMPFNTATSVDLFTTGFSVLISIYSMAKYHHEYYDLGAQ